MNQRAGSPGLRKYLLVFALVLFVVISFISFRALPNGVQFHWWALPILILVTTPLTVLANSAEFRIMGLINGHRIAWMPAARLTVIAGAANLLPLPGGIVIRTQALRSRGSSYKHALAANAAAGIAWIGMACVAISVLFLSGSRTRLVAIALAVAGILSIAGVARIMRRVVSGDSNRLLAQLVVVEAATVLVSGARIFFAFRLIGLSASAAQSVALTASQIIAAAVGIFPAGLGLREVLAGGIGSAVNLPASESISATACDRITSQASLAILAMVLLFAERRGRLAALDASDAEIPAPAPKVP